MPNKIREGKTRIISVVKDETKEALQKIASKDKTSLSGLVNAILEAYIKKNAGKV